MVIETTLITNLDYFDGLAIVVWHSYFLISWQSFYAKRANHWRNFFSSSGNAIWLILLKYQEIDLQIQTFTDEDLASYTTARLNANNC